MGKEKTKSLHKVETSDAILEIYTEEMPYDCIHPLIEQTKNLVAEYLEKHMVLYKDIKLYVTPRRLTIHLTNVNSLTKNLTKEIFGPPKEVGIDKDGNYTKAVTKFLEKNNAKVEDLCIRKKNNREYFCIIKSYGNENVTTVLSRLVPHLINNLQLPKRMFWDESKILFIRPIRNIFCMYGKKLIPTRICNLQSSHFTYGLFPSHYRKIKIESVDKYFEVLKNNYVIVSQEERRKAIIKILEQLSKKVNKKVHMDEELIDETVYSTEYPSGVLCKFDDEFLSLPEEVIIACVKSKQKCFPLYGEDGKVSSMFIAIRNGLSEHQEIVSEGYSRVVNTRLTDAKFFIEQDKKIPLYSRIPKLKDFIFYKELGSYYDKTLRVVNIGMCISKKLCLIEDAMEVSEKEIERVAAAGFACKNFCDRLIRATLLSKTDLTTELVKEYPELQGIAGRMYALLEKEDPEVATAIEEHYYPTTTEGKLPTTLLGCILSIADKIDTLVCDFAVGIIPTGAGDPYGLRKCAIGVIRNILEKNINIELEELFNTAISYIPSNVKFDKSCLVNNLYDFFKKRLETLFSTKGYKYDEVDAVLNTNFDNLSETALRLSAVKALRSTEKYNEVLTVFRRINNILEQNKGAEMDEICPNIDLMQQEEEKKLWEKFLEIKQKYIAYVENKNFSAALHTIAELYPSVNSFFEKVLVMTEDIKVRENRIKILKNIISLFGKIADFSVLQHNE